MRQIADEPDFSDHARAPKETFEERMARRERERAEVERKRDEAHAAKLAEDPDYRAKWEELESLREDVRRATLAAKLRKRGIAEKDLALIVSGDFKETKAMASVQGLLQGSQWLWVLSGPPGTGKSLAPPGSFLRPTADAW